MRKHFWVCLVFFASLAALIDLPGSWAWRRRHQRWCPRQNCVLNSWSTTERCPRTCGGGVVLQHGPYELIPDAVEQPVRLNYSTQRGRYVSCNTRCCPVNCWWGWTSWGPCLGCGTSTQTRTMRFFRRPNCGRPLVYAGGARLELVQLECELHRSSKSFRLITRHSRTPNILNKWDT